MVGRAIQRAGRSEDLRRRGEVVDRRDLPREVVQAHRSARRARGVRADREQAEVVVVVTDRRAHEHRPSAEGALHDLEPEDPAVELGAGRRVADVQDRVVQAGDGDGHGASVPGSGLRVDHRHAATGRVAGAPTSFQPDCQVPWLAMLSVMFRNARASSWRDRLRGPTSTGLRPMESTSSRTVAFAAGSSPATKPSSWTPSAIGSVWCVAKSVLNALTTPASGSSAPSGLAVRGGRVDLRAVRAERDPVRHVDDGLAGHGLGDLGRDLRGAGEGDGQDDDVGGAGRLEVRRGDDGTGRCGDRTGILRVARRDEDRVSGSPERGGEGLADVAGTDDRDIHWVRSFRDLTSWPSSSDICCGHNIRRKRSPCQDLFVESQHDDR